MENTKEYLITKSVNLKIKISEDDIRENPREYNDNLGKMLLFHRKYQLGDLKGVTVEEAELIEHSPDNISVPIYMYDHSGLTIASTPFSCKWDSGKLGFIYAKKGTEGLHDHALKLILEDEIREYNKYVEGLPTYTAEVYELRPCPTCNHVEEELLAACSGFDTEDQAWEYVNNEIGVTKKDIEDGNEKDNRTI